MADEPPIVCVVCGTANPPTATDCRQCGIKLAGARKGPEVTRLLEDLTRAPASRSETEDADEEEEGLDLDKEIVDELLDSLLLETSAAEAEAAAGAPAAAKAAAEIEMFECPMCGTEVAADAPECPKCHTKFAALGEAPVEPAAGLAVEAPAGESPAVAVSEGE